MAADITNAIYSHRLSWKPSSLQCISSINVAPHAFEIVLPDTLALPVTAVEEMECLGVMLNRNGATTRSVDHRMVQADHCFVKYAKRLCNKQGGVRHRIRAFQDTVALTFLHNAGGWHANAELLSRIRAWENNKLRKMFALKRRPEEPRTQYLQRTSKTIGTWFAKLRFRRLHELVLMRIHKWASEALVFRHPCGDSPLASLLRSRSKHEWEETRQVNAWLDPHNTTHWRHWRPGQILAWENPMVNVMGTSWWDAAGTDGREWHISRPHFVSKCCEKWGLLALDATPTICQPLHALTTMKLPIWTEQDKQWMRSGMCFEFRVDNQLLSDWCGGRAACAETLYRNRILTIVGILAGVVREHGWAGRQAHHDWIKWIPRQRNRIPDALANLAMNRESSVYWKSPLTIDLWDCNLVAFSDGGRRSSGSSGAGWALYCWRKTCSQPMLLACGAVYYQSEQSLEVELQALELSVGAVAHAIYKGEVCIPHELGTLIQESELEHLIC